jgi:hypothetical protein
MGFCVVTPLLTKLHGVTPENIKGLDSTAPCKHNKPSGGPWQAWNIFMRWKSTKDFKVISTDLAVLFRIESSVLLYLFPLT